VSLVVGVVDYGMGNLHSVAKALTLQNATVILTDQKKKLSQAQLLVVPGVGAFGSAMVTLAKKKLDDFISQWIEAGKLYLGICLGFQLLFERSEETPGMKGLSVFKGSVVRFRQKDINKISGKIPHMGWNKVHLDNKSAAPIFQGIKKSDYFYFVHSYFPSPKDNSIVATKTTYGQQFCSSISAKNLFACQFHPEKSGQVGLTLLKNIITQVKKEH
jgi:glutamine amidotransferase